jgi:hypothetical protein
MATIANAQDLLTHLGAVVTADDPIAALEQRGHQFTSELKNRLRPQRPLNPAQQRRWKKAAAKAGAVKFTAPGAQPRIAPRELAAGEYEFSAGVKMPIANEILGGLHANGTVPDVIFLEQLVSSSTLDLLLGAFIVDRPGGRPGRLQITAPPTIAPIRDGFDRVALTIPVRLNLERISTVLSGQIRTVVTFATGRLILSVGLKSRVATTSISARTLEVQIDLADSTDARIEIDADSPVQRRTPPAPGEVDGLAILLQNALQQRLAGSLRLSVSAAVPVPIGRLEIDEIAVLTRGDALLMGVKVQGTPGAGNPETLTAHFANPGDNFFTRVHDEVLRLMVRSAVRSGELTRLAKATHPDAVIESADVVFGTNTIQVVAKGKIVDLCPLGVDLGFTATTTVTITLEGTVIRIHKETSTSPDTGDAILCAITSLGLALIVAVAIIVFNGLSLASGLSAGYALGAIGVLTLILEFEDEDFNLVFGGGGGDGGPIPIELDFPFPGTDLLPRLNGMFMRLDESTMLMSGVLATRTDDINTYFYMRFLEADGPSIFGRAMAGATVSLMDRDSPPPAGDDVTFPAPSTTTTATQTPQGPVAVTKRTSFVRTADERFAQVTADHAGRVRFYIPHDKLGSRAGTKIVETTRENLDTDEVTRTTQRTAVPESRPDFYFRVTRANGTAIDTLQLPAGFFQNFQSARIGTRANPLTITFGGGGPIVLDPILS